MTLDLPLDDSQTTLRDGIARYLADHDQPGWAELAGDLGLMSIGIPESAGGGGGGATERALTADAEGPKVGAADGRRHGRGADRGEGGGEERGRGAGAAVGDVWFSDMEGRPHSEAFKGVVSDQNP